MPLLRSRLPPLWITALLQTPQVLLGIRLIIPVLLSLHIYQIILRSPADIAVGMERINVRSVMGKDTVQNTSQFQLMVPGAAAGMKHGSAAIIVREAGRKNACIAAGKEAIKFLSQAL